MNPVFELNDLHVSLQSHHKEIELVRGVSFAVAPGECLGILGESGSGKSMSMKAAMGLLDHSFHVKGSAQFQGEELLGKSAEELRRLRGGKVGIILQNPMTCFDPLYRIGQQIAETFSAHNNWTAEEIRVRSLELLKKMRIRNPEEVLEKYPHQLSGGMLQRIMIGIATAMKPALLIADEPTTAIDAITQYEILNELLQIKENHNTAMIFISHDLNAISRVADRIVVLNHGAVVDRGDFQHILHHAQDPYTKLLVEKRADVMRRYTTVLNGKKGLPMLELKNINVSFRSERQDKIFGHTRQQVLFDVSLAVKEGTCLGILGESGSGKSTMGRVLCGLLKPDSGEAVLDGVSVYASRAGRRNLQNKLSIVFQDYTTSANPRFRIRDIIGEGLTVQERREGKKLDWKAETSRLLELVGLSADFADRFPHELSGGQLQRVCIARAVACKPEIILFDEAISSLDAHTQVQVMDLLRKLKDRLGLTYIFITHDLTSITYLCDDVLFLYQGRVTESLPVERISETKDEYARKLLESIVVFDTEESA